MTTTFQFLADLEDDEEDLKNVPFKREKDLAEQTFLDNVDVYTCSKRSTVTEPKSSQGL